MNVYVSPAQRARMREFNAVINWSKVAAAAFDAAIEAHLRKVEMRKRRYGYMHNGCSSLSAPSAREE